MLVGRERELALLAETVERARHGSAGSVVVRGEPGVGKSALLDELVRADGRRRPVLRTQGLEVEAPLAFAALHRLLRPLTRLRTQLPPRRRGPCGWRSARRTDRRSSRSWSGWRRLSLLTAAAEEQLVLCVVDDAHWLDPATADALLFCARRIEADRVAHGVRSPRRRGEPFRPEGLDELTLAGLDPDAARALLDTHAGRAPRRGGRPTGSSPRRGATRWRCWSCRPS